MPDNGRNDAEPRTERAGLRAFWSGTLSFGLVSIPVDLFTGTRTRRGRMRTLGPNGVPLKRQYYCPAEDRPVSSDELVRGYPIERDQYVRVSDEELESAAPEKSRDIDLTRFVDRREIDPMLLDRTYFLLPAGESTKAYRLLVETMERTRRAGIASFVMRGKAYVVAIFAEGGVLQAETLRFGDELRTPDMIGLPEDRQVEAERLERIAREVEALTREAVPEEELQDRYTQRLLDHVARKQAQGQDVVQLSEEVAAEEVSPGTGEVIDLMQLLKQRLEEAPAEPESAEPQPERAEPASTAARRTRKTQPSAKRTRKPPAKAQPREGQDQRRTPRRAAPRRSSR